MKTSLQRVLSFALALAMILGMVPMSAFAEQVQQTTVAALSETMDGLSIAYPYNTETVQQTGEPASRFNALTFESARNEVESAQMILSPSFDVTAFELKMNSLKNEKGNVIPSWAFEVYIQHYVSVTGSGNAPYWSDTFQMYNPTYSKTGFDGTYPDALIPQDATIDAGENKISAGKNGGIWVNLNVQGAAPGTYTGTATLTVNGTDMDIPVSVRVYDVSLPEQVHTKSSVGIWWDMVEAGEGYVDRKLADTYFDYLVSKRIMPYDAWSLTRWDEAFAEYAATYLAVSPEISSYGLYHVKNAQGSLDVDALRTTLTTLINKNISLAQSGSNVDLFKKAYLYFGSICDEPRDDAEYRAVNNITAQVDSLKAELAPMLNAYPSLKASFMSLKHLVTGPNPTDKTYADKVTGSFLNKDTFIDDDYGNTALTGDSYVYAPQYQWLNTESQRALYENEDELWWYGCCHPISPYPTYHINAPLVSARVESWMRYAYGIDGFVYSSVNIWGDYTDNGIAKYDYWNSYVKNGTPGDQILVLPGSDYDVYGPIGTIRIENIREANEDYEYLWMLQNEYGVADISTYTAGLYNGVIADTDASIHYNNRKALLTKLEQLNVAANGATEIAPGNEGFVRGQEIAPSTSLTLELGNTEELATLSFDYKVTSGTFNISLNPDWDNAFGYFAFNANGCVDPYEGVTLEKLDDGYFRVTFKLDALTKNSGNPGKALSFLYIRGAWTDATGYIDNIQYVTVADYVDPYRGQAIAPSTNLTLELGNTEELATLSFDYKVLSGTFNISLNPDWDNAFGYFAFDANGNVDPYDGVTLEKLDDGYTRVTFDLAALTKFSGNPGKALSFLYIRGKWTDATGYIDNVQYTVAPSRGQAIAPSTNLTLELGNTEELATLSFDYKVTSGTFNISLNPDWDNAFGYFAFDANGNVDPYDGVTLEKLDDGYTRVTFDLAALTKVSGNPGKALSFLYIRGAWTDATGFIDNVQYTVYEPTLIFEGGAFTAGSSLTVSLDNSQAITKMSFDYKIDSGDDIVMALMPDWDNYYGYYAFTPNGNKDGDSGFITEKLGNGYVRVFVDMAALNKTSGNPSSVLTMIYIRGAWTTASGVIENIRINEEALTPSRGQAIAPSTNLTLELGNTEELATLSFDYKVTSGTFNISLNPDWDNSFGYFAFNADGNVDPYDGVTLETLEDGYTRVTFDMAKLTKFSGNPGKALSFLYIRGAWTDATGFIDNIQFTVAEKPEEPADRGQTIAPNTDLTIDLATTGVLGTLSFDYKITSGEAFAVALNPNWDSYYGYFSFGASGSIDPYNGVTTEVLDDGYIRVTFDMDALTKVSGTPSKFIDFIYIRGGWTTANGFIDNVQWTEGCEHNYETVAKEPTFTEVGGNVHTCTKCGNSYITDVIPAHIFQVKQWNVALADDICATFHLNVDNRVSDAKVKVLDKTYNLSDLDRTDKGAYILSVKLAAAQMTEDISIQIVYGDLVSDQLTYTIRQYAEQILTSGYSDKTKALVKAMLNYGAMAQTYFGYNTDRLANKDYVSEETVELPAVDTSNMISGNIDGISFYGASLVFETNVAVRFYFKVSGDINDYTFSTGTPVAKDGMYYIEVPGINPQDYDKEIALTVNDALTVRYSPLTYISRMADEDNALTDLVEAMYEYHLAAKAYCDGVETLDVSYSFAGNEADRAGYAEGVVTIAGAEAGRTYEFYWANENGKLSGYRALGSVTLTAEQTTASLNVGENVTIPAGADRLIVCVADVDEAAGTYLLGAKANSAKLETKFAVISDVHTNYNQGEDYLKDALKQFETEGVSYIIVTGDIGESDSDYAKYVSAVEKSNFSGLIFASIGNHDQTETGRKNFKTYAIYDGLTKAWVGIDNAPAYFAGTYAGDLEVAVELAGENLAYYVVTVDENAFIFMDQELTSTGNTPSQDNFSKEQLNFVEDKLYQYSATHKLFIIEHAPVEQLKIGDKFDPGYGGAIQLSAAYPNNQRFVDLLMEYTEAIWLSGHTHVQYDTGIMYVDKYYDASEKLTDTAIAHAVHVSSLAQPRWYEGTSMKMPNDFSAASQGYVCYQYAGDIVFEARSFKDYTPDSINYNANLFINEIESAYSWAIPLETLTHDAPSYGEEGDDEKVTLVDYAVAENGIKRAGNPTWEDTADGLKVTFAAASDRFEIKTGDQSAAFAANYDVQFKIKTDLTSFDLGGCNYSGSRKTYMKIDLTASGDTYTVTDLADGWKLVTIPMSNLGHDSIITEFAIRFYNTNAAGTFTLKELYIAPYQAEEVLVDYAVAENGNKRAGNPTWEDTADGLKVTFAAASDRFEIKTGDQSAAFAANYDVQFKIKTDLTSFDLGGCNYSGSRKTYMKIDLTASGDTYTVKNLADGWKLVTIPMSNLGHDSIITEFAIRFYNTNAAGTFTLKQLHIAAEVPEENETGSGRVLIAGDVHVSADDAATHEHLKKTLTYAKNNGVDLLIFNGDTVNVGNEADYAALDSVFTEVFGSPEQANVKFIFNMGNHEFYPTSACAHEETDYALQFSRFAEFASKWSDFTAEQGSIYLTEVNGISYIVAAPSDDWTYIEDGKTVYCAALGGYHENDIALIDSLIAQATANNPGEPVYLLSHHPWGETYGGASYGMPEDKVVTAMRAVMEKYPHLVNVTSHTHFSSLHERSFAQDAWTTINTGMHTYGKYVDIETDVNGTALDYVNIDGRRYTGTDAEGKALHGTTHFVWDVTYGEESFTATILNVATETIYSHMSYTVPYGITAENKSEKFAYELTDRTAPTLTWSAEDVLSVELVKNSSTNSLQIAFNDAEQFYATEGYRINVLNAATDETLKTVLWASRFWAAQEKKDSYEITVDGLVQCKEYKVTVEAIDFYGNYSAAKLEATVKSADEVQTETALLLQKCNGSNADCSARDYSNMYFATTPFTSTSDTLTLVVKTDYTSIKLRALSNVSGEWSGSGVTKNLEDLGDGWKTATWTLSELIGSNDITTMNGFRIDSLVDGMDILMKDILINNQTDWVGEFQSNYHGVVTQQQIEVKTEEEVVRGQEIKPSTSLTLELGNTEELATLSFDYKVLSGTFNISLNPDWDNAFGYFAFDANGNVDPYDGVTLETLDDGYIRVTFNLAALTKLSGNPGKALSFLYIRGAWTDATGYIDNVQYTVYEPTLIFNGGEFVANQGLTVELANDQVISKLSFDYKITSGDAMVLALMPDWDNYFGYYAFNANGNIDGDKGITTKVLENGYIRVYVDMAALNKISGNPSNVLTMIYIRGNWTSANGIIENIRINDAVERATQGEKINPGTDLTLELANTSALSTLSFDYKLNSGTFNISLNPSWDGYYGYFAFDVNGNVDPYDGVTLETLSDGYIRVTFDLNALTKASGSYNSAINFLFIRGAWTDADGYIDNIQFA